VQSLSEPVDLTVSPIDPGDAVMETSAAPETSAARETSSAPVTKLSFKEVISSVQKQNSRNKNIAGIVGTSEQPTPPRLLTLSTPGGKNEDTVGKKTRSIGTVANEPAQKKPPQNSLASSHTSSEPSQNKVPVLRTRDQDMEKDIEDKVRKSCQNIQWVRGPLLSNVDHWFYDLRDAGTVPPASLVAASRLMFLAWKKAQGLSYFPFRRLAGGMVLRTEHAHRTFKALTLNMPISGWVSRACAKHHADHSTLQIPTLVAKDGDPLETRPCPLIYNYEQPATGRLEAHCHP
jgi:hypothetical protein